jgi:phenylpropionate dioxygenase-like ring-hydroxylating dioxygenase large terminal subunit
MVHAPTRGNGPVRFGPGVPMVPDIGPTILDADVYRDPERFERERMAVLRRSWQVICRSEEIAKTGDFLTWQGHGETIIVSRQRDGGVAGFHNVDQLTDLAAAPVECAEWGGWVWAVLAGPGVAPPLAEWLGADITTDLGAYRMQDMKLVEKLVWDVPVNWKVIVDAFNENYHAAHLHVKNTKPQDVRDGRFSTYFVLGRHGMMVIPYKGVLPRLRETHDHQSLAICHYTLFPTAVFNCNPTHIQLFRSVPLTVDSSRFECWELQYADGDEDYDTKVNEHWGRLKGVVAEDVEIWDEVAATRHSSAYRRNILNDRECKITAFHRTVQEMLDA